MQRIELVEMSAVESDHWWFTGKRLFMRRLLGAHLRSKSRTLRILDVGCGTGANAVELSTYGEVIACDRSLDALGMAAGRGVRRLCAATAPYLPFAAGTVDVVTAYDIVEHVEDDAGFLRDLERVLMPGGALAIHVPAWPSMWSGHDEILEHKRATRIAGCVRFSRGVGYASSISAGRAARSSLRRRRFAGHAASSALSARPLPRTQKISFHKAPTL